MSAHGAAAASAVAARWVRQRAAGLRPRTYEAKRSLVLGDADADLARALEATGRRATRWSRTLARGQCCEPWPPPGPFVEAWVRMPRSSREAAMLLHAAAARVPDNGGVYIYGANTEGIRSAARHFSAGTEAGRVPLLCKRRCRVLQGRRRSAPPLPDGLDTWRVDETLDWGSGPRRWVSYPGVFAYGRLDPATALLVECLARLPARGRIVDFGAGSGVVGAALLERAPPSTEVYLLDHDVIALEAARQNVPGARIVPSNRLGAIDRPIDLIASNPPIHEGGAQSLRTLRALVRDAAGALGSRGRLVVVTQRRLGTEAILRRSFSRVERMAEQGPFRVWCATPGRGERGGGPQG